MEFARKTLESAESWVAANPRFALILWAASLVAALVF
jgi:hypothetical protein